MRLPHDNIEGSMMTGLVEGTRNRGRPRTCWIDNIVAWTDQSGANLLRIARDRGRRSALTHPPTVAKRRRRMVWYSRV